LTIVTFEEFEDEFDEIDDSEDDEVFNMPVGAAFVLKLFNRIGLCCCLWLSLAKDI
jgi:hypothetical protein